MVYKNRRITVKEGEIETAKIGHGSRSETKYPCVYQLEGGSRALVDCGGFLDTRGINTDIAVSTSITLTLENANSVHLVLCYDSSAIFGDRATHLMRFLDLTLRSLVKTYQDHYDSILLLLTKPTMREGLFYSDEEALDDLASIEDELPVGEYKTLFQFLLRDDGKYVHVYNPLKAESRAITQTLLNEMTGIRNTKDAFQTFYAHQSRVAIFQALTTNIDSRNRII